VVHDICSENLWDILFENWSVVTTAINTFVGNGRIFSKAGGKITHFFVDSQKNKKMGVAGTLSLSADFSGMCMRTYSQKLQKYTNSTRHWKN